MTAYVNSREHLKKIFTRGMSGITSMIPSQYHELERRAQKAMPASAFGYVHTGAGEGLTRDNNTSAFDQWVIRPEMPNQIKDLNTSTQVGRSLLNSPIMLAPVGVLSLAHEEADVAVAKAVERAGSSYILSSQASRSMEECMAVMPNKPGWFQLYHSSIDGLSESFIKRAERCGCEAIVITLDTTKLGWRPIDIDHAFLPFLHGDGLAQYTADPVFLDHVRKSQYDPGKRPPVTLDTIKNVLHLRRRLKKIAKDHQLGPKGEFKIVQQFINHYSRPQLDWDELDRLRNITDLPVFLKGILRWEDALEAKRIGFNGLIISNHGGRQIDGCISSIDALVEIREHVADDFPLIIDSGIRTGQHIFKCLALGAQAVAVGRPYVYALALCGEEGVVEYLSHLRADFELTMSLSGCERIEDINHNHVQRKN